MLLQEMTWPQIGGLGKDVPIVIPVAALEQHGRHMPVFTDSMLLGEVVRRAAARLDERVVFAPLIWFGNSHHHMDFPGTLSASPRTYLDVIGDVIDDLTTHGFRRLVVVNGHGGNIVPNQQAVFEARQRYRQHHNMLLLSVTYWLLGGQPWEANPALTQRRMGHACEWETSMMLRIAPQLVGDLSKVQAVPFDFDFEGARGWTMKERSVPGHIGDPTGATAEKGETLFQVFADDLVKYLTQVAAWRAGQPHP